MKMTSGQVVETSVNVAQSSPSQDDTHLADSLLYLLYLVMSSFYCSNPMGN